jgi:hypothetical protein
VAPAALGPNDSAPSPRRGRVDVYWLLPSALEESAQVSYSPTGKPPTVASTTLWQMSGFARAVL